MERRAYAVAIMYTDRWTDDPEHTMPPARAITDSLTKDVNGNDTPAL